MIVRISHGKYAIEYCVDLNKETLYVRTRNMDDMLRTLVGAIKTYEDLDRFLKKRCNNNDDLKSNLKRIYEDRGIKATDGIEICQDVTIKDFVTALQNSENETPLTIEFDSETDGERKYGQQDDRWWDETDAPKRVSKQKNHLITHFACWYFHKGGPNCKKIECKTCFDVLDSRMHQDDMNNKNPKEAFNRMIMPELFICTAELLGLNMLGLNNGKDLETIVDEIMEAMDTEVERRTARKTAGSKIAKDYITWDKVEKKLLNTLWK